MTALFTLAYNRAILEWATRLMEQSASQVVRFFVHEVNGQEILLDPVFDSRPVFIIGSDPRSQLVLQDGLAAAAHAIVSTKVAMYTLFPRSRMSG